MSANFLSWSCRFLNCIQEKFVSRYGALFLVYALHFPKMLWKFNYSQLYIEIIPNTKIYLQNIFGKHTVWLHGVGSLL